MGRRPIEQSLESHGRIERVIGGIGRLEGPILGVIVFYVLQSTLADYGAWYLLTLGLIAIAVMLFAPRGLWGLLSERTGLHLFPVQRRLLPIDPMSGQQSPKGG